MYKFIFYQESQNQRITYFTWLTKGNGKHTGKSFIIHTYKIHEIVCIVYVEDCVKNSHSKKT